MSQISGQFWQVAFDIRPGAIPAQQRVDGKSVPQIMQVWPFCSGRSPQTNPPGNAQKLPFCG